MKHLKSSSQDLRNLFENNITIEYIAEPLKVVTAETAVADALQWMDLYDFDVMGVTTAAAQSPPSIQGYVERSTLHDGQGGQCGDYQQVFHPSELVAVSTPLLKLLPILQQTSRVFVLDCNQVSGILTCGDLQKAPVRMLLFGLVTLLEMNLLRLIRRLYPLDSWQAALKSDRVEAAKRLWQESQARNEATHLTDYLQFCDKRDLVLHHPDLWRQLGLPSKRAGDRFFTAAEQLRNRLAHAQNLVNGSSWSEVIGLAAEIETLLRRCEEIG